MYGLGFKNMSAMFQRINHSTLLWRLRFAKSNLDSCLSWRSLNCRQDFYYKKPL